MALLGQSAFLKALGWALLNSIWQMAILWLVYLVLSASLRKQLTAHIKHSIFSTAIGYWFRLVCMHACHKIFQLQRVPYYHHHV